MSKRQIAAAVLGIALVTAAHAGIDQAFAPHGPELPVYESGFEPTGLNRIRLSYAPSVPQDFRPALEHAAQQVSRYIAREEVPVERMLHIDVFADVFSDCAGPTSRPARFPTPVTCFDGFRQLPATLFRETYGFACNSNPDFTVKLNLNCAFHTGINGQPGANEYDLVTTAMHQFVHALGFFTALRRTTASNSVLNLFDEFGYSAAIPGRPQPSTVTPLSYYEGNQTFFVDAAVPTPPFDPTLKLFALPGQVDDDLVHHFDPAIPNGASAPAGVSNRLMVIDEQKGVAMHQLGHNTVQLLRSLGWPMRRCEVANTCGACFEQPGCNWCGATGTCGDASGESCPVTFLANSSQCN